MLPSQFFFFFKDVIHNITRLVFKEGMVQNALYFYLMIKLFFLLGNTLAM